MASNKITLKEIVPDSILNLSLASTGNKSLSLKNFSGKNTVIYFYPKDDTPGCTVEGKDFSSLYKDFTSYNTEILGVSRDNMVSHEKFKKKYQYVFDLISDPDEKLCQAFGVIKGKSLFGKTFLGVERSTFLLDTDLRFIKEWRKVKVKGHAKEVLNFVKNLNKKT